MSKSKSPGPWRSHNSQLAANGVLGFPGPLVMVISINTFVRHLVYLFYISLMPLGREKNTRMSRWLFLYFNFVLGTLISVSFLAIRIY